MERFLIRTSEWIEKTRMGYFVLRLQCIRLLQKHIFSPVYIAGTLVVLMISYVLTPYVAASTWTQTSDSDFNAGTKTSVLVSGTGSSASVILNGGTFTSRRSITIDNTIPGTTYSYLSQWGSQGTGNGQFNRPILMAKDSSGNIYVSDFDSANGLGNHRVQKFDSSGTYITQWGSQGSGNGQFGGPFGIAIDSSSNVYVADYGNHRIQKFDTSGNYVSQFGSSGTGNGQFNGPTGIGVDSSGNVYVADNNNNRIQKFDSSGTYITQWGSNGTGNGQFDEPLGVVVDTSGNVYVADQNNNRVQKFNSSGTYITQWGLSGSGNGQFSGPWGVSLDTSGNVYVTDPGNSRVQKFNSSGTYITQWGSFGSGNGQFNQPTGIVVDNSNIVYVGEYTNYRVQKFTANPALTNNRVNLSLTSSNFDFSATQSAGQDVRFLDSDTATYLNYWVESWNAGAQTASVWALVPSIAVNATSTIYMYYGNSGVTSESASLSGYTNSGLPTSVGSASSSSQVVYPASGTFISSGFNTAQISTFTTLSWTANVPANTTLSFQLRSADTEGGLTSATWYGPTSTSDSYTSSGTSINSAHEGNYWIQYKAVFARTVVTATPTLNDVSVTYGLANKTFTSPATICSSGGTYTINNLTVDGTTLTVAGGCTLDVQGTLTITNNGTLLLASTNNTAQVNGSWVGSGVTVTAVNVQVNSGSTISANNQGYTYVSGGATGNGPGGGVGAASGAGAGGGYGGVGATVSGHAGGTTYGSPTAPIDLGSAGGSVSGSATVTGNGGGIVRLTVSGTLTVNGTIDANGGDAGNGYGDGGGSGGSVYVTTGTLTGSGSFTANGGAGKNGGGGGGGGRVAVYYTTLSSDTTTRAVEGGTGANSGGVGTIVFLYQAPEVPASSDPNYSFISDTISTSNISTPANHSISFVLSNAITASNTIAIVFPSDFSIGSLGIGDIDVATSTTNACIGQTSSASLAGGCNQASLVSGNANATQWGVAINSGTRTITLTSAGSGISASGSLVLLIGTNAQGGVNQITNPSVAGSYQILITGATGTGATSYVDSGDTWVVVQPQVVVSGSVASSFTFVVTAINNGDTVNGTPTNITSTPTAISFGSMATSGPSVYTAGHILASDHNATYGFSVVLSQDGNFRSQGKSSVFIPNFNSGTTTPAVWTDPSENIGDASTWASFGVTTSDGDIVSNANAPSVYYPNGATPRWIGFNSIPNLVVLNSTSSAKSTIVGNGRAEIGYRVQISELQPAANDYRTLVRYIATPTF